MNTPNRIYTKHRKAKAKPAAFVSAAKRKPSIWERGVGGGSSGKGRPFGWRAGAHAGSSWAGLLCLILLGACDHIPDFKAYAPYDPPTQRQPHVQAVAIAHKVAFTQGTVTLDATAGRDIDAFLARQKVDRADALEITIPAGGGEIARGRAERVAAYLKLKRLAAGLVIDDDPKMPADAVRLVVHRYQVALPGCPDWTERSGLTHANQPSGNWGCATAVNLGLMVADPGDLVRGRDGGPGDGAAQVLGIQRYRKGETKPLLGATTSEAPASGTGAPASGEGAGK
jgi:pilus assembly protein CpaD